MHQRRGIVLLFGLGIVLPSVLLSDLAFRGTPNDRTLVEKERLEGTRRAADQVVRTVDDGISAVETALSKIVPDDPEISSAEAAAALERQTAGDPLVGQALYHRDSKNIRLPIAKLLYGPDGP
jgi:hypothetical protein